MKDIDYAVLERASRLGYTASNMARLLGISIATFFIRLTKDRDFATAYHRGREERHRQQAAWLAA